MIPRVIHYCWFGRNPLDAMSQKCIDSWKAFFPGYEIKCWNEDNFDVSQIGFMKEAYDARKWAFVSDVARLIIIYENGGIYFDTDVEVIAPFDDILSSAGKGFFGFESTGYVASGLGFGAEKGAPFLKEVIEEYRRIRFADHEGLLDAIACPVIMTNLMEKQGYARKDCFQQFREFAVFPSEYFSPLNYQTGRMRLKKNTHSIHWGNASWNASSPAEKKRLQRIRRVFGIQIGDVVCGIVSSIEKEGLLPYLKRHF